MLRKYLFTILIAIVLLASVTPVFAWPTFKQGTDAQLNVPCSIDGDPCSSSAMCNATIINSKGEVILNNQPMIQNGTVFTTTLSGDKVSETDEYQFPVTCCDVGECTSKTLKFYVTPSGIANGSIAVPIIFLVLAIFFFGFALYTNNWVFAFFAGVVFIIGGIYVMIYGVGNMIDDLFTRGLGGVIIGIGLVIMIASSYEAIQDGDFGDSIINAIGGGDED